MASNTDVARRIMDLLMQRPEVRSRARRARNDGIGLSKKPNAPKLITIFVSLALTVIGLAVTEVVTIQPVVDLLAEADLTLTESQGWMALAASPVLLVLGSFFRGL